VCRWFESTRKDANTGFFMVKKQEETSAFLEDVLAKDFEPKSLGDQTAINESLYELKIKRAILNPLKFSRGCASPESRPNTAMQHATCAHDHKQKINQMNHWRSVLKMPPADWESTSFGSSCINWKL
jgi:hypothetical protein